MDDFNTMSTPITSSENATFTDDPNSSDISLDDEWQRILLALIFIIGALVGIIGNSLVIISVLLSRKLRSPTNVFVVTLSVADLLTGLAIPWNVVALLSFEGWPIADWVCSVAAVALYVPTFCSVMTLASIGINRLVIITRPVHIYQKIFQTKVLCVWIAFLWIWPFILTVTPPLVGFGALGYNNRFHSCTSVSSNKYSDQYDLILSMVLYPIPLLTIIVSYIWIFIHVRNKAKKLNAGPSSATEDSVSMTSAPTGNSPGESPTSPRKTKAPQLAVTALNNNLATNQRPMSALPARILAETDANRTNSLPRSIPATTPTAHAISRSRTGSFPTKKTTPSVPSESPVIRRKNENTSFTKRIRSTIKKATDLTRISRRQLAITKNMFYVVIAYIICLTPFVFCLVIDTPWTTRLIPYAAALILVNSCINPMIYATKHPYFKKIFGYLVRCQWHKIPEPSDTLRALRERGFCDRKK